MTNYFRQPRPTTPTRSIGSLLSTLLIIGVVCVVVASIAVTLKVNGVLP